MPSVWELEFSTGCGVPSVIFFGLYSSCQQVADAVEEDRRLYNNHTEQRSFMCLPAMDTLEASDSCTATGEM